MTSLRWVFVGLAFTTACGDSNGSVTSAARGGSGGDVTAGRAGDAQGGQAVVGGASTLNPSPQAGGAGAGDTSSSSSGGVRPVTVSMQPCVGSTGGSCTPQSDGTFQCRCVTSLQSATWEAATCQQALEAACNTMPQPPTGDRSCTRQTDAGEVSCSWHQFASAPDEVGVYRFQCSCAYLCPMSEAVDKSSTDVVSPDCDSAMDSYCGVEGPLCPSEQ